jgi:hypothetical protein
LAGCILSRIGFHCGRRLAIHPASQCQHEFALGDLKNKYAKIERDGAHRGKLAWLFPQQAPPPPPRCRCGLTYPQVKVMWAHQADRWSAVQFSCLACLPDELRPDAAMS